MTHTQNAVQNNESRRARIINIINDTLATYSEKTNRLYTDSYQEEPIVKTASQLNNYTPDKIIKMRQILQLGSMSPQELFYRQGIFMADFEDDFYRPPDTQLMSYKYPTYQSMRNKDLRMYFTWRSKVRKSGIIEEYIPAFVMLYIYEIVNLIGFEDSQSAFCELVKIYDRFSGFYQLTSYLNTWYRDFVAYYNLDISYLDKLPQLAGHKVRWKLLDITCCDEELFDAICASSVMDIKSSPGYQKSEGMYKQVMCDAYRRLYVAKKAENKSLLEELFSPVDTVPVHLFSGAVFYQKERIKEYTYGNELYQLSCKDNRWYLRSYDQILPGKPIKMFVKFMDHHLRTELKARPFKNEPEIPNEYKVHVHDAIIAYKHRQQELLKPKITIDVSLLGDIRAAADITMHKLIVEEDISCENDLPCENEPEELFHSDLLDDIEVKLIKKLINNEKYNDFLRENKLLLSVIVDNINEKLFDTFQDTVVITDGNNAELIEDYIEDLKGLVNL